MNDLTLTKRCQRKRWKKNKKQKQTQQQEVCALGTETEIARDREREGERCILVDISAKRLDPADNLNLLRAPSRVSQSASSASLLLLSTGGLEWQTIIRTWGPSFPPRELPLCHKCRRAQAEAEAEEEAAAAWWKRQKLMDVYAGWQHWNCHCASAWVCVCVFECVCCLFVPHCVPQRKSLATGMDLKSLSDWALWSDCGSNLCFNFSLKTMHNLQFHC